MRVAWRAVPLAEDPRVNSNQERSRVPAFTAAVRRGDWPQCVSVRRWIARGLSGPARRARVRSSSFEKARDTVAKAIEPYRTTSGDYRLNNTLR